jgi:hypothetical protein
MNGNRFTVPVAKGFGQALTGFGDRLVRSGELERSREAEATKQQYIADMKRESAEAYASGDVDRMIETGLKYPEISKTMETVMQHKSERTKESYQNTLFDFYVDPTEQNARELIEARQTLLGEEGADAAETDAFLEKLKADPEGTKKQIEKELAFRYPDKMKRLLDTVAPKTTANLAEYDKAVDQGYKGSYMDFRKELSAKQSSTKQKTATFLVRDKDGNVSIATGSYDTKTGELKTETAPLKGLEVVSKLGETAEEQTGRKVKEAGEVTAAKEEEKSASTLIDRGIAAAESTATIRRAIDLLDTVKTGGLANLQYQAKRIFGIEGADEGELSNSLGKAVLSQLRETFGAAFTENEGKRLERIEGSFGKSPATNKRLLQQALRIANNTAKRARKKALDRGQQDVVDDIDDLLSFSLSMDPGAPTTEPTANPTTEEYNALPVGATYFYDGIEYRKK